MSLTLSSNADRPCRSASLAPPTPASRAPAPAGLRVGDTVFHYREGDNAGSVVDVRRPWWALFGRVYWVQWREGVLPVPMHTGLRPAPGPPQVEERQET